ncbi:aminotransferase class III-fold pyridoxal phosphate-dependent enzyme [Afipia sp. GAS231]|uniref:aminotransferase class III-fold pyridoxal phosphate-dependent enzyme n=1 Tax=Afipia sp. GAS231 TaxID=1882747 RepID=UPI00087C2D02|nr:aminotransferase class III-fold pyridoxal phosphate-dependent enzyme [Afipia sp. GAS231]SDN37020.1 glutamate-1-semialdehyde 2,1-aminomutase [Afipia sp. GAS231]
MSIRYAKSEEFLARARHSIPLGAQTFSKSVTQYPFGVSPYFVTRGKGSKVWDIDGNEYIDFINGLCSVTLGYSDADVNAAVATQLEDGTIYSLSHPLETEVAELLCEIIPSAEMVRFGKNGSDATAGAVRIARAFTGRDHVLTCGYHGWQDWYIGGTARNKGVPQASRDLTHAFPYNDLPALEKMLAQFKDGVAAVIMEPMNVAQPEPGYLEGVKALTHAAGALLVFDETITGFRYALGGAQELFNVAPDITTLGKGIANGFPLSAVCGRRDVMQEMEEVFFSFTMGGETLSLAAAKATIAKLRREPVIATMRKRGSRILTEVTKLIDKHGIGHFTSTSGDPTWSFLLFRDLEGTNAFEIKTLWMQEMMERGLLSVGTHNISYAHSEADVDALVAAYDAIFPILRQAVDHRAIRQYLKCEPLEPLFRVR